MIGLQALDDLENNRAVDADTAIAKFSVRSKRLQSRRRFWSTWWCRLCELLVQATKTQ